MFNKQLLLLLNSKRKKKGNLTINYVGDTYQGYSFTITNITTGEKLVSISHSGGFDTTTFNKTFECSIGDVISISPTSIYGGNENWAVWGWTKRGSTNVSISNGFAELTILDFPAIGAIDDSY